MSVPPTIARLISEAGGLLLPGVLAQGDEPCEGARFHSPRPMLVREFEATPGGLVEVVGVTERPGTVWLCGLCADNVNVALHLLAAHDGSLPWQARRGFGHSVRSIARRTPERTES